MANKKDRSHTKLTGSTKLKRTLLIVLGCFVIIAGAVYYCQDWLLLKYSSYQTNTFKINDKVYAPDSIVNGTSKYGSYNFNLYRLVKTSIEKGATASDKPFLLRCNWVISSDSLRKYKTAFIGTYQGIEILPERYKDEYMPSNFYVIAPNKKALIKEDVTIYKLPAGYSWADGPFYVSAFDVTDKELTNFRKD